MLNVLRDTLSLKGQVSRASASGRIAGERKQAMMAVAKRKPRAQWKHVGGFSDGNA